jgi:tripartite-type tricarboxylate transporter receptor subunit TctC
MKKYFAVLVAIFSLSCLGSTEVIGADAFPSKPITILVPFKAGGGVDVTARFLSSASEKYFGVPLVVENKPGGSGLIAADEVAKAVPDGYTILATTCGSLSAAPHMYSTTYDPEKAFVPIISLGITPMFFCAGPSAPAKDFEGFYKYAKENPNKVTAGCAGIGDISGTQLAQAFKAMNLKIKIVPFNGAAETLSNTLGGHIMYGNITDSVAQAHIKSGKLFPLFVFGGNAGPYFKEIPTLKELGYEEGDSAYYKIIVAPAATPAATVEVLREGFKKMTEDPGVQKLFENAKAMLIGVNSDPVSLKKQIDKDYKMYGKLINELGLSKK